MVTDFANPPLDLQSVTYTAAARQIIFTLPADGVIAHPATGVSCDFPFQVPRVPGGVASYDISVSHRPPQRFDAKPLRENAEAIIAITA